MEQEIIDRLTRITEEEREILAGQALRRGNYTLSDKFIVNEKKLLGAGKQLDLRLHTRFIDFPEHGHDYLEFMYVYAGTITHVIDGETVELACGDILFLNRHIRHSVLKAGQNDIGINFIVSNDFLKPVFNNVRHDPIMSGFLTRNFAQNGDGEYLHFSTAECFPVRNLTDNLIYALAKHTPDDTGILTQIVSLLFSYLSHYRNTLKSGLPAGSPDARLKQAVSAYLSERYPSATLTELADELGYSPEYLSRKITALFGKNFRDLLSEERLKTATLLLKETKLSASQIAETVGYENCSHFYSLFRAHYGVTPRAYRFIKTDTSESK